MRINRCRLDNTNFPHECRIATRFDDIDSLGHINNVAAGGLLQEARVRFGTATGLAQLRTSQIVVAAMTIEFAHDAFHPDDAQIQTGVLEISNRSYLLGQVLRQRDRVCVYAEVALVSRNADGAISLAEETRSKLVALIITQS